LAAAALRARFGAEKAAEVKRVTLTEAASAAVVGGFKVGPGRARGVRVRPARPEVVRGTPAPDYQSETFGGPSGG